MANSVGGIKYVSSQPIIRFTNVTSFFKYKQHTTYNHHNDCYDLKLYFNH